MIPSFPRVRTVGVQARRVVVIGGDEAASELSSLLESTGQLEVLGILGDRPNAGAVRRSGATGAGCGQWGCIAELPTVCSRSTVDGVLVALSASSSDEGAPPVPPALPSRRLTVVPNVMVMVPLALSGAGTAPVGIDPATAGPSTRWPRRAKRMLDLAAALALLVLLLPLLVALAVAVRVTSAGPVLFSQTRVGYLGREFRMLKFRSMRHRPGAEPRTGAPPERFPPATLPEPVRAAGPFPKLIDDPRVTRVGRFIRRFSLDELPQLLNVVAGQMSLVGPRPYVPADAALIDGWAASRQAVLPGITGLWQVSGRNDLSFEDMCRLDQLYVSCWSIGLDARIMTKTLGAVLRRRGAY